jgi:hypothetical protein
MKNTEKAIDGNQWRLGYKCFTQEEITKGIEYLTIKRAEKKRQRKAERNKQS